MQYALYKKQPHIKHNLQSSYPVNPSHVERINIVLHVCMCFLSVVKLLKLIIIGNLSTLIIPMCRVVSVSEHGRIASQCKQHKHNIKIRQC